MLALTANARVWFRPRHLQLAFACRTEYENGGRYAQIAMQLWPIACAREGMRNSIMTDVPTQALEVKAFEFTIITR